MYYVKMWCVGVVLGVRFSPNLPVAGLKPVEVANLDLTGFGNLSGLLGRELLLENVVLSPAWYGYATACRTATATEAALPPVHIPG